MDTSLLMKILEDGMFAAMAAIGFSSISHTPSRMYFICALAAAVGHSLRMILMSPEILGMNIIPASAIAALAVGVVAVFMAPMVKAPAEACLFPALLPMIPGMYAYRTIEALVGCLSAADQAAYSHYSYLLGFNCLTCVFVVVAMVIGANIPVFALRRISFQATR